jgi:hypothetical protein
MDFPQEDPPMTSSAEQRDSKRVIVGPEHTISFTIRGHAYRDIRITNLSVGGCFALVGAREARVFMRGAALENVVLQHPELPKEPIIATVAYVLGGRPGSEAMETVGLGVQFMCMEASTRRSLEVWLEASMASEQASS